MENQQKIRFIDTLVESTQVRGKGKVKEISGNDTFGGIWWEKGFGDMSPARNAQRGTIGRIIPAADRPFIPENTNNDMPELVE